MQVAIKEWVEQQRPQQQLPPLRYPDVPHIESFRVSPFVADEAQIFDWEPLSAARAAPSSSFGTTADRQRRQEGEAGAAMVHEKATLFRPAQEKLSAPVVPATSLCPSWSVLNPSASTQPTTCPADAEYVHAQFLAVVGPAEDAAATLLQLQRGHGAAEAQQAAADAAAAAAAGPAAARPAAVEDGSDSEEEGEEEEEEEQEAGPGPGSVQQLQQQQRLSCGSFTILVNGTELQVLKHGSSRRASRYISANRGIPKMVRSHYTPVSTAAEESLFMALLQRPGVQPRGHKVNWALTKLLWNQQLIEHMSDRIKRRAAGSPPAAPSDMLYPKSKKQLMAYWATVDNDIRTAENAHFSAGLAELAEAAAAEAAQAAAEAVMDEVEAQAQGQGQQGQGQLGHTLQRKRQAPQQRSIEGFFRPRQPGGAPAAPSSAPGAPAAPAAGAQGAGPAAGAQAVAPVPVSVFPTAVAKPGQGAATSTSSGYALLGRLASLAGPWIGGSGPGPASGSGPGPAAKRPRQGEGEQGGGPAAGRGPYYCQKCAWYGSKVQLKKGHKECPYKGEIDVDQLEQFKPPNRRFNAKEHLQQLGKL